MVLVGVLVLGAFLARAQEPSPAPPPSWSARDCATCHESQVNVMRTTRHAGLEQSCASCHDAAETHMRSMLDTGEPGGIVSPTKWKAADVNAKCLSCHDKGHQANFTGGVHERRQVACTTCHSVHAFKSDHAQLKTLRDSETCFTCHKDIRAKTLRTSHHPIREGLMDCASCHDPHDGSKPKMVKAEWVTEQCLKCHTEKRGPFLWEHAPVRENCALCHDPHGSNHDKMLVAKQPFLCQRCHLNTRHPGTLYDGTNTLAGTVVSRPGAPTLSNRAVEHGCKNCHQNVHGGNAPSGPYLGR
jgi:DmsE family decaheme c-type cytochrome